MFDGPVYHPHIDPVTHQLNVKQVFSDVSIYKLHSLAIVMYVLLTLEEINV